MFFSSLFSALFTLWGFIVVSKWPPDVQNQKFNVVARIGAIILPSNLCSLLFVLDPFCSPTQNYPQVQLQCSIFMSMSNIVMICLVMYKWIESTDVHPYSYTCSNFQNYFCDKQFFHWPFMLLLPLPLIFVRVKAIIRSRFCRSL